MSEADLTKHMFVYSTMKNIKGCDDGLRTEHSFTVPNNQ